jgi:hypothetical protein
LERTNQPHYAIGSSRNSTRLAQCRQPERVVKFAVRGMPFLFVDELTAEMPAAVGANSGIGRMHVQLALSGEWQGAAR